MFTEEEYGVIVMSDITDVNELAFGYMDNIDEKMFSYLEPDRHIRISN